MPSNSYDYTVNRDTLVEDAYREIGVVGDGQTMTGNQLERGVRALNLLLASFNQRDIKGELVTTRRRATLFLQKNQGVYQIGTDHCTTSYFSTTATASIAPAATSIQVASSASMAAGDYVGVLLTSGYWEWHTVATIPDGTHYTIAAPGMTGAAASGATIVNYTTRLAAPLEILTANLRDTNNYDTPISLNDTLAMYEARGDKSATGDPASTYVEYGNTTDLYFDVATSDASKKVQMVVRMPFSDMDTSVDTFDTSKAAHRALKFALAVELAPQNKVSVSPTLASLLKDAMAPFTEENSLTTDVYFQPGAD